MSADWLWSGVNIWQWLVQVGAQTIVGAGFAALILTPFAKWIHRFYKKAIDPYSPGGAGDAIAPNGERMHRYLAKRKGKVG